MEELFDQVSDSYQRTGSIGKTAQELSLSTVKVRRVLITLGLWSSGTSERIGRLHERGLSVGEIARELYISEKNVQAYLPYSRGTYGKGSYDARMSKDYRQRQKYAAEHQAGRSEEQTKEEKQMGNKGDVMKLQLTLQMDYLNEEELRILQKYGNVREGISRTVYVPADMPLHALHYLLNRAFGWQNSHLHAFEFPKELFAALTQDGKLSTWGKLCGIYFRFPDDSQDIFWDDDYREGVSFKTWLRKKYQGPYLDRCVSERYKNCQAKVDELRQRYAVFEVKEGFWEMVERQERTGEEDGPRSKGKKRFEEGTIDELTSGITFEQSFDELIERNTLCQMISTRPRPVSALKGTNPVPLTSTLFYNYDFGDNWMVRIDCVEEYTLKLIDSEQRAIYVDKDGNPAERELVELLDRVGWDLKPVCTAADGLPVMDDAGGVSGYIHTLQEIREHKDEEYRDWARMQGWTGRKVKPENIL